MNWRNAAAPAAALAAAVIFVSGLAYLGTDGFRPAEKAIEAADPLASAGSAADSEAWVVPDIATLPDDSWGRLVRRGRELTTDTVHLIGPDATDPAMRFAGSRLECSDCHLKAGTRRFGMPFVGVYAAYPQYSAREGAVITLEDRINGCMTRSVNGRPLPVDSPAMQAFVAYMKFLSEGRPDRAHAAGLGLIDLPWLTRAADPTAGERVYAAECALCHGDGGLGRRAGPPGSGQAYEFPPLAGPDSFNDGAGMARLIGLANFVDTHMPAGTTPSRRVLTDDEAWDVAAYVESLSRPHRADLDRDYPVRIEKPVDTPYGPYVDGFSEIQHKYGPFQPIEAKLKALAAAEGKPPSP